MNAQEQGSRAAMRGSVVVRLGAVLAVGVWLGCNTIIGLEAPEHETPEHEDQCTGNPDEDPTWADWVPDTPKRYVVTDDVVVDTTTDRTWQRAIPDGDAFTWQGAKTYCENLSLPGYPSGWRLPTRIELVSIVDYTKLQPAIDKDVFLETPSDSFWSSSPYANDSTSAWCIGFYGGNIYAGSVDESFRVRCVH